MSVGAPLIDYRQMMKELSDFSNMFFEKSASYTKLVLGIGLRRLFHRLVGIKVSPGTTSPALVRIIDHAIAGSLSDLRGLSNCRDFLSGT